MALYVRKRESRHRDLIDSYYQMLNEAEKYRDKENAAAIIIQKDWIYVEFEDDRVVNNTNALNKLMKEL